MTTRTPTHELEATVLDAAATLLAAEGPDALSVRRIATAAGVAPMSIYNRFDSKAGVIDALIVRAFDRLAEEIARTSGQQPIDRLRSAGRVYRAFAHHDEGAYRLMFDQAPQMHVPSAAAAAAARASFGELVELVRGAQEAGQLGSGDPVELAQRLWAALHGAVSLESRGICFAPDTDQHFADLVDTVLDGMGATG